jgi:preprotein translocase subunit SecG
MNQFWEIEGKASNDKKIGLQKPKLKEILEDHLNYELIEKCRPNECKDIFYANLENSISYSFLASTDLYTTDREWNNFVGKYLNYWKQILKKAPHDHKVTIRKTLVEYFQNFFRAKGQKHGMSKSLKNQLEIHGEDLQLKFNGRPFHWSVTKSTTKKPKTTTQKSTSTKPRTQSSTSKDTTTSKEEPTSTTKKPKTTTQKSTSTKPTMQSSTVEDISTEESTSTTEVTSTSPVFTTQSSTVEDISTEESTSTTEVTSPVFTTQSSTVEDTSTEEPASTTEVTSPVFTTQSSTVEDTSTEEPTSTTEVTSTSPVFAKQSSTIEDPIVEIASAFTAEQFKRSTIEGTEIISSDTTEKIMVASTSQNFITKTVSASVGIFLGLLAFLGFVVARKKKSGVYRTGEKGISEEMIGLNNSFTVNFSDSEEESAETLT